LVIDSYLKPKFKVQPSEILTNISFLIALATQLWHAAGVISCCPSLDLVILSLPTPFPLKTLYSVEFWENISR